MIHTLLGPNPGLALLAIATMVAAMGFMLWLERDLIKKLRPKRYLQEHHSPEALKRAATEFYARKERDTPKIRKEFEAATVGGVRVVEVGDLEWWPQTNATLILGAVRLSDGRCLALGYDGKNFEELEDSKFSWVMKGLAVLPLIKLDDDCIAVQFSKERYMMAEYGCPHEEYQNGRTPRYRWRYTGIGCTGATAMRAFEKHGMTFSADFTPSNKPA